MVSVENLTVEFGGLTLFDEISFVVNRKDRIALVGRNGAGKTTLLKIFAGMMQPSSGAVSIPKDTTVGYLPQQMKLVDTRTVRQEAELAFENVRKLEKEIDRMNEELAQRTDYDSEDYHNLIERVAQRSEQFLILGGNNYRAELERTLIGLGFSREDLDSQTSKFSGGWRMRIELAKLLLSRPDILLLDEPTNHLDIESIQWLENFIATRANAVIIVSHDRAFINQTTFRTIEIELGKVYDYKVKYSEYLTLREERREQQLRAYDNQQKKLADTEAFIERFRFKSSKAIQVQSRIRQMEKVERIEVDDIDTSSIHMRFPPTQRSGTFPVIMDNVSKQYGEHTVFEHVNLSIRRGEKVAFVGKNGAGKSTLVKCIMSEISFGGKLEIGHNTKIGYFAQNEAELLDETKTVFDTIDYIAVGDVRTKIRGILGAFMFGTDDMDKKVGVLSGGERSRLAMIKLLLTPVNLLILDEPTNHLDMRTKDVLKNALREFDGTIIVVSHDREFLDGLVNKVYEFGGERVREHLCGIYEFLEQKKLENLRELERKTKIPTSVTESNEQTDNKISYETRKEQNKNIRKTEKAISETEEEIATIESSIAAIEKTFAETEGNADPNLYTQYSDLKNQLDAAFNKWTTLSESLELLKDH